MTAAEEHHAAPAPGSGTTPVRARLLVALLLACFAWQVASSMAQKSATFDEPVYIAAGYAYLDLGDFRLKRDAPPLVATLSGLMLKLAETVGQPILFPATSPTWEAAQDWASGSEYRLARELLDHRVNDGRRLLLLARVPILLTGLLLGVVVYRWGEQAFGVGSGLLAVWLYSFDPNMIGHARVVSADLPLAAFFLASHYWFWRHLEDRSQRFLAPFAVALALALCTKYTGLLALPSLGLMALILIWRPGATRVDPDHRRRLARRGAVAVGVGLGATLLLMMVLYQRFDPVTPYLEGLGLIYDNVSHDYQHYLLGEFSPGSWPHYYLVATLLKTPEPTLILLVLAFVSGSLSGHRGRSLALLLAPVILVHLVCSQDIANIGLRRVLLTYPFLFILAGSVASAWRSPTPNPGGWPWSPRRTATLALFAIAALANAVAIHPHQLSYFNLSSGGPSRGHRHLDDANLDWGQDLPALRDYLVEHGITEVVTDLRGVEPPASYGIRSRPMSPAEVLRPEARVYAVSVHNLVRMELMARAHRRRELAWLDRFEPSGRAGYSIYIYDFRARPRAGPAP